MACIKAAALLVSLVAWPSPVFAQDLPTLLWELVFASDRTEKEHILLDLTERHPDAGPARIGRRVIEHFGGYPLNQASYEFLFRFLYTSRLFRVGAARENGKGAVELLR